ncbi:MAG TPA: hypothetical protein VK463_11585 [Desulfomonilaceae bacterium]|nr:hypothetical protein [Desulfomonilaceae bacterium]
MNSLLGISLRVPVQLYGRFTLGSMFYTFFLSSLLSIVIAGCAQVKELAPGKKMKHGFFGAGEMRRPWGCNS